MPRRRSTQTSYVSSPPLIIIGAGIHGTATAYFLSLLNPSREIHILESSPTIFSSASVRTCGFIARNWFSSSIIDLGILSFDLHKKLAEQHGGREKWGYSASIGLNIITPDEPNPRIVPPKEESCLHHGTSRATAESGTISSASNSMDTTYLPRWLETDSRRQVEIVSQPDSTAQIDPPRFCKFLMGECIARGVHLHLSTSATRVHTNPGTGAICSVELSTGITIPCAQLLITAGVWTPNVFHTLFPDINPNCPVLNVSSLGGYAIVYRCPPNHSYTTTTHSPNTPPPSPGFMTKPECHAIFTTYEEASCTPEMASFIPEMFSRHAHDSDQEIYVAGVNIPNHPFPPLASDIPAPKIDDPSILRLRKFGAQLLAPPPSILYSSTGEDSPPQVRLESPSPTVQYSSVGEGSPSWVRLESPPSSMLSFSTSEGSLSQARLESPPSSMLYSSAGGYSPSRSRLESPPSSMLSFSTGEGSFSQVRLDSPPPFTLYSSAGEDTPPQVMPEVIRTQICHRAVVPWGKPIMGRIPDELLGLKTKFISSRDVVHGVYTCVGHGHWGTSLSTGCGLVMAEILEGKSKTTVCVELLSVERAMLHGSSLG